MHVIASAGHVDHGKSTLIRALTGIETDRWEEEKKRGLTIDLGFAWCELPSGRGVSFVDVPGHERFIGNMLAGLGPVPIVLFVVAADEGWREQSSDHRDAVRALGIEHGVIVVTRADRAPENARAVLEQARRELGGTGLADAPGVIVSGTTGEGIDHLRAVLDDLVAGIPIPDADAPVRLWIDRSFTISGAGTVVTGTLGGGRISTGDELVLVSSRGENDPRTVSVRGVQSRGESETEVTPVSRAAINLRGIDSQTVHRGDVVLTPGTFHLTNVVDVRSVSGEALTEVPRETLVHVGTAALNAVVRPLGGEHARLTFAVDLPLLVGDHLVLRGTGDKAVLGGVRVLDVDPPELRRRGAGAARAGELGHMSDGGDPEAEVLRRGAVRAEELTRMGIDLTPVENANAVVVHGPWLLSQDFITQGRRRLRAAVSESNKRDPLNPGVPRAAAIEQLSLPDAELLPLLVSSEGLAERDGRVIDPAHVAGLGAAEAGITALEKRLKTSPFAAPEAYDLDDLKLGSKELAAAAKQGRILRLSGGVVLLPSAPALAMRELAQLEQPFTTSQARAALGTTRRIVIPLLEHLDSRGWTRRIDAGHREIVR